MIKVLSLYKSYGNNEIRKGLIYKLQTVILLLF